MTSPNHRVNQTARTAAALRVSFLERLVTLNVDQAPLHLISGRGDRYPVNSMAIGLRPIPTESTGNSARTEDGGVVSSLLTDLGTM